MWKLQTSGSFDRQRRRYEKKRPPELAAVLRNLDRLLEALPTTHNFRAFYAGYLHHEPHGVWAIDQHGPSKLKLQETRLYLFPDEAEMTLHIITLGNKSSQAADLQLAAAIVHALTSRRP